MAQTISVFTYNGERDILRIHLNVLNSYVDKFIIVEANQTFTGHPKILYFFRDQRYFKSFWGKIDNYVVNDWEDDELWSLARNSPNTKGAHHWQREFYIKEHIQKALRASGVQDDDTLLIGDVDEIIDPTTKLESDTPIKAHLRVYAYYLDNLSNEQFYGTLIAQYKDIKGKCLNHMRSDTTLYAPGPEYQGYHFTSQGGLKEVQRKLNDSYTPETYNTAEVQTLLPERHRNAIDYLGRNFQFIQDTENWPQYLKDHQKEYKHLCLPEK